jgi:hypothetical protein
MGDRLSPELGFGGLECYFGFAFVYYIASVTPSKRMSKAVCQHDEYGNSEKRTLSGVVNCFGTYFLPGVATASYLGLYV